MTPYWKARAAKGARDRDRIAEMVANGMGVADAGRALGVGPSAAYKQWGIIKAGLGWQAV